MSAGLAANALETFSLEAGYPSKVFRRFSSEWSVESTARTLCALLCRLLWCVRGPPRPRAGAGAGVALAAGAPARVRGLMFVSTLVIAV